jgi:hypothetical protein
LFAAHGVSLRHAPQCHVNVQAQSRQTNPNGGALAVVRAVLTELGEILLGVVMMFVLVIFVYQG